MYQAGYTIISPVSTLEYGLLPNISSAQKAELIALTRACQLAKGKSANIYTYISYAFGVALDFSNFGKKSISSILRAAY